MLRRSPPGSSVVELGIGEEALGEPGMPLQRSLEALDLQQVDADAGRDRYFPTPTTTLVRLRSPSVPLPETK
jgi:hypothetical protein